MHMHLKPIADRPSPSALMMSTSTETESPCVKYLKSVSIIVPVMSTPLQNSFSYVPPPLEVAQLSPITNLTCSYPANQTFTSTKCLNALRRGPPIIYLPHLPHTKNLLISSMFTSTIPLYIICMSTPSPSSEIAFLLSPCRIRTPPRNAFPMAGRTGLPRAIPVHTDAAPAPFGPIVCGVKRDDSIDTYNRLTTVLADLVYQVLDLVERMNPAAVMYMEAAVGEHTIRNGYSALAIKLRERSIKHRGFLENCATELAWCLDNFWTLGAQHISLSSDCMNGFFVGPKSAAEVVDSLLQWIFLTVPGTKDCERGLERLATAVQALHFERHDRLVGRTALITKALADTEALIMGLKPGPHRYEKVAESLSYSKLAMECRQALVLLISARLGIAVRGETQLLEMANLLRRCESQRPDVVMLGPGVVPRRLWDCLLPYVSVDQNKQTLRGTIDQLDWLVTGSYSGEGAGLSRRYCDVVGKEATGGTFGVVRECYRPTIDSLSPSEVATLQWLLAAENPLLQEMYQGFRAAAEIGYGPRSRRCAEVWLRAYDLVKRVDPPFADGLFTSSTALGATSLIAAASDTVVDFKEGILTRYVATLSNEGCLIETASGESLRISKDDEGAVWLSAPENAIGGFLAALADSIDRHSTSRGTQIRSTLQYQGGRKTVPNFVGSGGIEAYTPAVWINLTKITTLQDPKGDG